MKPQIAAGKLRPLAVSGSQRLASLPDVPTFSEQGYPGVVLAVGAAVVLPACTPQPIVDKLADALGKALDDPGVVRYFEDQGVTSMRHLAKRDLADSLAQKRAQIRELVERAGIQAE